jgi:hypothetical protein
LQLLKNRHIDLLTKRNLKRPTSTKKLFQTGLKVEWRIH